MNSSIGLLNDQLDAKGLILPSRPVIDCTEWGARSCTIAFRIRNKDFPRLDPCFDAGFGSNYDIVKNYPAPPPYPRASAGQDADLSFLGAQSSRFTRNGGGQPGLGLLEVLYRGAIFAQPATGGYANAAARIAATTTRAIGDVAQDFDTGLYWSCGDNTANVAASWHLVPIFTPPWKTSGRTRSVVTVPIYTAGVADGSAAVTYWAQDYTWQYVIYADFNGGAIIAPFDVGVAQPSIINVEAFNAAGAPVANPSLGIMRVSRSITQKQVACGRYFECTETLQMIFVADPPSGLAGGAGEVLIAEATEYIQFGNGAYQFVLINKVATAFTLKRLILKSQSDTGTIVLVRYRPSTLTETALVDNVTVNPAGSTTTTFPGGTALAIGDRLYIGVHGFPAPFFQAIEWHVFGTIP